MSFIWVALGGGIGSALRLGASQLGVMFGLTSAWSIASINVLGSLIMGYLSVMLVLRFAGNETLRIFLTTGILGGFTTFSAFSLDAVNLMTKGQTLQTLAYVIFSVVISIAACFLGISLARVTL